MAVPSCGQRACCSLPPSLVASVFLLIPSQALVVLGLELVLLGAVGVVIVAALLLRHRAEVAAAHRWQNNSRGRDGRHCRPALLGRGGVGHGRGGRRPLLARPGDAAVRLSRRSSTRGSCSSRSTAEAHPLRQPGLDQPLVRWSTGLPVDVEAGGMLASCISVRA